MPPFLDKTRSKAGPSIRLAFDWRVALRLAQRHMVERQWHMVVSVVFCDLSNMINAVPLSPQPTHRQTAPKLKPAMGPLTGARVACRLEEIPMLHVSVAYLCPCRMLKLRKTLSHVAIFLIALLHVNRLNVACQI